MSAGCQDCQQWIAEGQGLVRCLAARIHRNLPPYIALEDLIGYGQVGLAEAARDFVSTCGTEFSTFAYYRIRGAIYDGLSKMTGCSRAQYRRMRYDQMANALLGVESEEGGPSADGETKSKMRWFRNLVRTLAVVHLGTQDARQEGVEVILTDPTTPPPSSIAIGREINHKLHQLIEALPDEERHLIKATYFDGMTLQAASHALAVSKSWASRLHARALKRLACSLKFLGMDY